VFSNVGHFRPNITFQGKSRRNPSESSLVRGSTLVSSSLACKCLSRVEVTNCGKHCSLLWYGKSNCRKMFYSTGPRRKLYWGDWRGVTTLARVQFLNQTKDLTKKSSPEKETAQKSKITCKQSHKSGSPWVMFQSLESSIYRWQNNRVLCLKMPLSK
jgi:hypothetical protein